MCTGYIYVRKTNRMQLYVISLFQLNYPLRVSNKQVHHQEVISVHAAYSISVFLYTQHTVFQYFCTRSIQYFSIFHAFMGCLAANKIRLELCVCRNDLLTMNLFVRNMLEDNHLSFPTNALNCIKLIRLKSTCISILKDN